jgi:RimJ/RimL family protein N-acetyltransferase
LIAPRILIRPYAPDQAAAVLEAIEESRVSLARWLPDIARRRTQAEVRAGLEQLRKARLRADRLLFGVWQRSDGRFLGEVGLHDIDWDRGSAAVGYWLRASARGRRLIDEALERLQSHATRTLGVRHFEAHIACENIASRRVAERHGYVLVGQRPADPRWDGDSAAVLIYRLSPAATESK